MLPNFIIVGAARSGTTSLNGYLAAHPEVFMCQMKEPHFFAFEDSDFQSEGPHDKIHNERIVRDLTKYQKLFQNYAGEKAVGETSPGYLFLSESAENIKSRIPECKIIILLRDPLARSFSHYMQHAMMGHENLDFEQALKEEENRAQKNWRWFYQYKRQSLYHEQVKKYLEVFERDQVKIILFEDLKDSPISTLGEISQFLDIDPQFYSDFQFEAKYKSGTPKLKNLDRLMRSKGFFKKVMRNILPQKTRRSVYKFLKSKTYDFSKKEIPAHISSKLKAEFREDILKLQALIEKNLEKWSSLKD